MACGWFLVRAGTGYRRYVDSLAVRLVEEIFLTDFLPMCAASVGFQTSAHQTKPKTTMNMLKKLKAAVVGLIAGLALTAPAMAQEATTPVQSAVSGLSAPVTSIITAALVVGMIVVGAKLAYNVAKKFLS